MVYRGKTTSKLTGLWITFIYVADVEDFILFYVPRHSLNTSFQPVVEEV